MTEGGGRIIYGLHPVAEAIRARAEEVECLFAQQGRLSGRAQALVDEARNAGVSVRFVDRERLRLMAGTVDHQGLVARVATFHYQELEAILSRKGTSPLLLVALDGVQDPRNLGAVLRSAEAFGAQGIVIPRDRAAGVTAIASKAAAGAAERIPVTRVTNLVRALATIKDAGGWIVGAHPAEGVPLWDLDLAGDVCLVVGGEEKGLRPLVAKTCDHLARIPLLGETPSLNASVAAGILLYETLRQRTKRPITQKT
jgi:23S rRNA (guanosine2251-2'-O)-methyltransferase